MRTSILCVLAASLCVFTAAADAEMVTLDADMYDSGAVISSVFEGFTLVSVGTWPDLDGMVYAREVQNPALASTGSKVFGNNVPGADTTGTDKNQTWIYPYAVMSVSLSERGDYAAIDIIANDDFDWGAMAVYDAQAMLLDSVNTPILDAGQVYRLEITRPDFDIAYVVASGVGGSAVLLDNLVVNVPEPATMGLLAIGAAIAGRRRRR